MRGFEQKESFNYDEIYSPVAKMSTIRTLLSVGNQYKYYFKQLDVKTAFLNGDLKENVYIYPAEGFKCNKEKVLKLKKSIYGLRQASKCWNDKINSFLLKYGFKRSGVDSCMYTKMVQGSTIHLLLYVEDIILVGPNLTHIEDCKVKLSKEFEMKDLGDLKYFLGLEINYDRDNGSLRINQNRYLREILKRFNFENCQPCDIPVDPKLRLELD